MDSYLLFACIWLAYGIALRTVPIVNSNLLWIAVEAAVFVGGMMPRWAVCGITPNPAKFDSIGPRSIKKVL